jgi:hypothetical protein
MAFLPGMPKALSHQTTKLQKPPERLSFIANAVLFCPEGLIRVAGRAR